MVRAPSPPGTNATNAATLARAALAFALLLATGGCGRACNREHPYVPYTVDDSRTDAGALTTADPLTLPPSAEGGARSSSAEPALLAPPNAVKWKVEGLDLVAPAGREILLAIVRDFDGDGKKDALAVVRAPGPPGKPAEIGAAEIVYFAGASSPPLASVVATGPAPRTDAACMPVTRLERIGPRSALAEVGTICTRGPSSRALFVVRLAKDPTVAFDLSVLDPPGAPRLVVDVDGDDRDHDGIDDVTLRVTIEGGAPPFEPGPKLSAKVAFFDRSAGPSRDPDEPDASLKLIAAQATARAGKSKEAATVPVIVQQMRMLYRAMCVEGGAPRLVKLRNGNGGSPGAVSC